MQAKIFLVLLIVAVMGSCNQSPSSSSYQNTKTEQANISNKEVQSNNSNGKSDTNNEHEVLKAGESLTSEEVAETQAVANDKSASLETDIKFIRNKFNIINKANNYKTVPFETRCDRMSSDKLIRKYNTNGELSYLSHKACGAHGCSTKEHYYWKGALIFIFRVNDYSPGSTHVIEEHRTYFKDGKMIRCLEKEARYYEGQPPMAELLKKAVNKEVDCTPEKRTEKLSELESLSLEDAQKYFCTSTEINAKEFSLTNGKLGYPSMKSFFFDINFDGKRDSIVALPGKGQRGRTNFIVYNSIGSELIGEPFSQLDSETRVDIAAKELSIHHSGGACGSVIDLYQHKDGKLRLVKRRKQNMEDGKCIESTYDVSDGIEYFKSKKELTI